MRGASRAAACVAALLGWAATPAATPDLGSEAQRATGQQLYELHCAQCHGVSGDGQGHATPRLKPAPRDFTSGKYKFRTTPSGTLPTDADLRRVIRQGLPYTSMPAWPNLGEDEIRDIIYYLKAFSADFANPDKYGEPIEIPDPPAASADSVGRGREVYESQGCAACHGELGRGDGRSAPTLEDDWGHHIRPADLTERWTFRGGPTRRDIFRTFSTGLNGTPMPSYFDSLEVEERWHLVDYIYSLGPGDAPAYSNLLLVEYVEDELDLERADELFAGATSARFPLVGQIMQPGRNFHPSTSSVVVEAVRNRQEIAFRVRWDDMRAETAGSNSPLLEVPTWDADQAGSVEADALEGGEDFWGAEEVEDDGGGGDDFWGEAEDAGEAGAEGDAFSDAVALQFPLQLPTGIRKPYFIFGDAQNPVDLWFVDLARGRAEQFVGRGSGALTPSDTDAIEVASSYDRGRWTVVYKRALRSASGLGFEEGRYAPIAFSVWDAFNRERGNKRALSSWFYLYVKPAERISPVGPMLKAALGTLIVELLIVFLLRRRHRGGAATMVARSESPVPATK